MVPTLTHFSTRSAAFSWNCGIHEKLKASAILSNSGRSTELCSSERVSNLDETGNLFAAKLPPPAESSSFQESTESAVSPTKKIVLCIQHSNRKVRRLKGTWPLLGLAWIVSENIS
ncbi:hypothetical protein Q1695_012818 [Nippostrongylus brasiliensis]|nr:hypothetical protein Q1695_012818 [Nippostrongylus brasiliensis]